ncbi:uncharacterized protein [Venturia canescens]|uniref:uncharacterized protein n=1 Tax=Venturia canescens TaxID=32260 RepID=UPI001C9BE20C|nr:uncharacterized protein LOC122411718 [Venturia canescens]XP_043276670.1 uncharacterized protein LOC122411718 [Venturia canescens]
MAENTQRYGKAVPFVKRIQQRTPGFFGRERGGGRSRTAMMDQMWDSDRWNRQSSNQNLGRSRLPWFRPRKVEPESSDFMKLEFPRAEPTVHFRRRGGQNSDWEANIRGLYEEDYLGDWASLRAATRSNDSELGTSKIRRDASAREDTDYYREHDLRQAPQRNPNPYVFEDDEAGPSWAEPTVQSRDPRGRWRRQSLNWNESRGEPSRFDYSEEEQAALMAEPSTSYLN